jgi:hypothetical protein
MDTVWWIIIAQAVAQIGVVAAFSWTLPRVPFEKGWIVTSAAFVATAVVWVASMTLISAVS